jgi:hypothetical protein
MAGMLINPGGESDRESIRLATSKNTLIPNFRRGERTPAALKEAMKLALDGHPDRRLRSLTSKYNCIGMAFANRRTCIEPDYVPLILREDEYEEIALYADVLPGDLVIYHDAYGDVSHVAVAVSNEPDLTSGGSNIRVLSQWGSDGEYLHDYRDVPPFLGKPVKFYSERRRA